MPGDGDGLLQCYNVGCGQKFRPEENTAESCVFHPGPPYFHDAYKGWSCCKKRCTDFTEFLNIKGCQMGYHSNVKPPEVERQIPDKSLPEEVVVHRVPCSVSEPAIPRPSRDIPLVTLIPNVSASLVAADLVKSRTEDREVDPSSGIAIGTSCKNRGCKQVYELGGAATDRCEYHPGFPVFHEGMKFWTCCQRRTTDFNSFLEQQGCENGSHRWSEAKKEGASKVSCRYDWHQTSSYVVVSVFAKKYDPDRSSVELNPVRLKMNLFFPEEEASFKLDVDLEGVVTVASSSVSMMPSKCEVKLRKQGASSWSKLQVKTLEVATEETSETAREELSGSDVDEDSGTGEVDLSDL